MPCSPMPPPSCSPDYEGFGFPILQGLAAGLPVLARRSELLGELAAHYRGPGQLLGFSHSLELVETLGRLKHGYPVESYPLGGALVDGVGPAGWRDAGATLLGVAGDLTRHPASRPWYDREETLRMVRAG